MKPKLMRKIVTVLSIVALLPVAVLAQQDGVKKMTSIENNVSIVPESIPEFYKVRLAETISVDFNKVPLEKALRSIAERSRVNLSYRSDYIPEKDITLQNENIQLSQALDKLLRESNLEYLVSSDGYLIIRPSYQAQGQNIAQRDTVAGQVVDGEDGAVLPGVNVVIKGTNMGTATNADGRYSLMAEPQDTLVFSYIGYQRRIVPIDGRSEINIDLMRRALEGEEVVVTGYSEGINRAEVTSAVSSVQMEDFEKRRVSEVAEALQGQVAGVQVTQSTGAPGDETQVRIRGEGTIGNNNPLYIIDGVPSRSISFISPGDIKSMNVLKDASASAIYGSRASGGVIVVETKQGTADEQRFNVNYYSGVSNVSNLPDMMNTQQYMNTLEEAWNNAGYSGTNPYTQDKGRSDFADTDWLDETFEGGTTHDLYLSASGGDEKTQYFMSSRFYTEDGVVVYNNDKIDVLSFRSNINSELTDRFEVGSNLQLNYSQEDNLNSRGESPGILRHAMLRPPVLSVKKDKDDPYYSEDDPFTDLPFYNGPNDFESSKYEWSQNPVALAYFTDDVITQYRAFGNVFGEYDFLKDKNLKFRTNLGVDLLFYHRKVFNENFGDDDGGGLPQDQGLGRQNRPSSLSENRDESSTITWNNTLNYLKEFNRHQVRALAGTEFVTYQTSNVSAARQRYDFDSENFRYLNFGGTDLGLTNSGTGNEWALFSYFTSASYKYAQRYMFTANFRADASSRFADNNEWGYFPSFSAGWMVTEEEFMPDFSWLTQFKIRASWGQVGNQEIPNYAYLTLLERNQAGQFEVVRYGNPDLKWETTTQTNFGFDALLYDRLNISVEYFDMLTSDILLPITLPEVVGEVEPTFVNSGEVRNKGLEFSVRYENYQNEFKYRINANMATLDNEVEKLHPNLPNIVGEVTRTQPGHPINAYYGYKMEGIYQNQQEINNHLDGVEDPSAVPGDIRFEDLNDDGVINSDDRTFIGDPHPDMTFGFNFYGEYKNFDFNIFLQGVQGVDQYNDSKKIVDYDTRPFNYTTRVLDAWDGEGSTNKIPRVSFTDNGSSNISSIYVEDASYLRLKSLEIGYSLQSLMGDRVAASVNEIRLFASAQNLFTITDYSGLDPEVTDIKDFGTYPQYRTLMIGINTSF